MCVRKITSNSDVVILNLLSLKYALIILIEEWRWEKNLYANNFYGDDYKNRVKRWMVLMRVGENEKKSIEKNIKAKLGGLRGWDGKKSVIKHHRSMNHRTNNPKWEKKRMEEKSKWCVCALAQFLYLMIHYPITHSDGRKFSLRFCRWIFSRCAIERMEWKGWNGNGWAWSFLIQKIWCSDVEENKNKRDETN